MLLLDFLSAFVTFNTKVEATVISMRRKHHIITCNARSKNLIHLLKSFDMLCKTFQPVVVSFGFPVSLDF